MSTHNICFHEETQSTLVILKFKALSEILRGISILIYKICRIKEKINPSTTLNK